MYNLTRNFYRCSILLKNVISHQYYSILLTLLYLCHSFYLYTFPLNTILESQISEKQDFEDNKIFLLQLIERKVDRLQGNLVQHVASHHNYQNNNNHNHNNHHQNNGKYTGKSVRHVSGSSHSSRRNETLSDAIIGSEEAAAIGRGKLVIRCNTPVIVEELLRDVASKVDVIFDKVSRDEEEVVKLKAVGDNSPEELREPQDMKLLDK